MAILKIRDSDGNVQEILVIKGDKGEDGIPNGDAVLFVEQTLTAVQKAQARENIGAAEDLFKRRGNLNPAFVTYLGNKIMSPNGNSIDFYDNDAYSTYKIPVRVIDGLDYYLSFNGGNTLSARVALYDVNDTYIPDTYVSGVLGKISISQSGYVYVTIGSTVENFSFEVGGEYMGDADFYLACEYLMKINNYTSLPPVGKKVAILGDSVTTGWTEDNDGTGRYMATKWYDYIHNRYGFESVTVDAEIGRSFVRNGSMSTRFTEQVEKIAADTDIIFVFGGSNDFQMNSALGTIDDTPSKANGAEETQKFYPAVKYCAEYLTAHFPNADIIFMTPLQRNHRGEGVNVKNTSGHRQTEYVDAIKEVCRVYGIYCIEMGATSEFKTASAGWLAEYMPDGLHPNEAGTALYVQNCLYNKLDEYFYR